jgi:hypothetical protein
VLIELGSLALPPAAQDPGAAVRAMCAASPAPAGCATPDGQSALAAQIQTTRLSQPPTPGLGISYMALVDGLLLFIVTLMAASLVVPARIQGRLQGIVSLVVSFLLILAGIVMAFAALGLLIVMVSLLVAAPFGTIVYLAIWGFFDRAGAEIALTLLMLLKGAFAVCMAIAHQSFLTDKGLLLMVGASLVANLVVAFLHGIVPIFLVSITDAVAGIVVAVIGIILAVLSLVGSVISISRALRPEV